MVGVAPVRQAVPGHMDGRVLAQCAGKEPDQADAAQERVDHGAHHFAEQRPRRVAVRCGCRSAIEVGHRRPLAFGGRGEGPCQDLQHFRQPDAGLRGRCDHRVEETPRDRRLQVSDEDPGRDLLAAEVPVHQRLILAFGDESLDKRAPRRRRGGAFDVVGRPGRGQRNIRRLSRHSLREQPGVSRRFTLTPPTSTGTTDRATERCWWTAAGSESLTVVPSVIEPFREITPVTASSASASIVFPAPECPTSATFRISAGWRPDLRSPVQRAAVYMDWTP